MKYEQAGTYVIKYTATDECGNKTEKTRNVIVATKSTTLFEDGTLIINELSIDRQSNILAHGEVVAECTPLSEDEPYNFAGVSKRPWQANADDVKYVKFGSTVSPVSIAYWFQNCKNFESIDWTNFDGSKVTTARAFCAGTNVKTILLPPMHELTNLRYFANQCKNLESVDFSGTSAIDVTDTVDAFQGCYKLITANLSGLEGTVATSDRMFANVNGDGMGNMTIETIYANSYFDFSQASSSANMFRTCTNLVGGNGTTFDSTHINGAYARIDTAETPGYFTGK